MSLAKVQTLAAQSITEVSSGRNLQDALTEIFSANPNLSLSEKGALQDMAYGCQRYAGSLRFMLAQMLSKPITQPELENILVVALYQLNHTRNAPHAVVNEAVEAVAHISSGRLRSFGNAILRRFLREKDKLNALCKKDDIARYNHPKWWIQYLQNHYPKHWNNIITSTQSHPPLTLRVNCRRTDAESHLAVLTQAGIDAKALSEYAIRLNEALPVNRIPGFAEGLVSVQDFGAQQAALILAPQNGERILDACAAPGGKTGHILELADCNLTALDIDKTRLARVCNNLERLGFQTGTNIQCADAQNTSAWYDGHPFDAILADVPCTASGVTKRHPDIKWLRRPTDALKTARQQEALLDSLWRVLKPGGRMLFATCSIFTEENGSQLHKFLNRHTDAHCSEARVLLPNNNQDGFYYALIQKQ